MVKHNRHNSVIMKSIEFEEESNTTRKKAKDLQVALVHRIPRAMHEIT